MTAPLNLQSAKPATREEARILRPPRLASSLFLKAHPLKREEQFKPGFNTFSAADLSQRGAHYTHGYLPVNHYQQ
jgi:hypothetical protein